MEFGVKEFEDKRWRSHDSAIEFRHKAAVELTEEGKVLDMGCGDGLVLQALKKKNCDVHGVDISDVAVKKCLALGVPATVFDFTKGALPFTDGSFDTVIMLDVLEHVLNPNDLLNEAARVSKKDIVISVPNFNSLPARLQAVFGHVPENNTPKKGHVYWFNYYELKKILSASRLTVTVVKMNTVYEHVPGVGSLMALLSHIFPNVFALSFVVKAHKSEV